MKEGKKIEGYWYNEYSATEYPMPVPNVLTEQEAQEIYDLIKRKEVTARKVGYKGFTTSRITGEYMGSTEFHTDEWLWPVDFAPHYVLEHKVKPTEEFLKYIGWLK